MSASTAGELVVLTGATGYVGGRLLPGLVREGYRVRCLVRNPEAAGGRLEPDWLARGRVEVCQGDVLDPQSLHSGLDGASAAFYLVHSMGSRNGFVNRDRSGAQNFAEAARRSGLGKIIYLGGLGSGEELSPHLASRHEVGRILRESGVPTIEFRASIIIGPGSLSFEMIRSLVRKLPVMITPKWVRSESQPISIEDVVAYLLEALRLPVSQSVVYQIGGPDRVSYQDLMREYARQRELKRWILPVPMLSPNLSSKWLGLVTPLYARVGRKLIDSVRHDTVVHDETARSDFPGVQPRGVVASISQALENEVRAQTRWSDAISAGGKEPDQSWIPSPRRLTDVRVARVGVPAEEAFAPIQRIGGATGWYFASWLWRIRGFLDLLVGGVGMRRGRPHPVRLSVGQPLDFWRVEAVDPPRLLCLRAEMRLPGQAWLQFEVADGPDSTECTIRQTASFDPSGMVGLLYWHALAPVHRLVFSGMISGIRAEAESRSRKEP